MHVVEPRLVDDADDRQHAISVRDAGTDWVRARKEPPREAIVDHRFENTGAPRLPEPTARGPAHSHHFDETRARADDVGEHGVALRISGVPRRTRNPDRILGRAAREWQG